MNITLMLQIFVIFGLIGLIMFVFRSANWMERVFVTLGAIGVVFLMFVR